MAEHREKVILGPIQLLGRLVCAPLGFVEAACFPFRVGADAQGAMQVPGANANEDALGGDGDDRDDRGAGIEMK